MRTIKGRNRRYLYVMKFVCVPLALSAIALSILSFTYRSYNLPYGGPKKVYKDTIYAWKIKPAVKPAVATKPVVAAKPVVARKPEVAEEDRTIRITSTITRFMVKKSLQKLYVYFGDTFKVFRISLGASPVGPKTRQGDNKTPEGTYTICMKNPKSRGYKSLKISYPNETDRKHARQMGQDPGGDIFIHGLWWNTQNPKTHWKDNWTRGCIAVNNEEIDEIFQHTDVSTQITIQP